MLIVIAMGEKEASLRDQRIARDPRNHSRLQPGGGMGWRWLDLVMYTPPSVTRGLHATHASIAGYSQGAAWAGGGWT